MKNENLAELERGCYLSKEMSRLYASNYEERTKVQDLEKEVAMLKQRIDDMENEQKIMKKNKAVLQESSEDDKALMGALIANEQKIKDELTDLRRFFIDHLKENVSNPTPFAVKKMGELDSQPFIQAMGISEDTIIHEAMVNCSLWNENIKDPHWHPFKIISIRGKLKEVIDEEDEKLKGLKKEFGKNVHEAVKTALTEMNEYNPSGRVVVPELWSVEENRKASLKEVAAYMLDGSTPKRSKRLKKRK
ncbi:factor of DNA methylation 5-like isoform X1 [Humulus lupulus]|uniref:factor of DNA methylation 5-like isoform X1 n=1 Tax=Humulus lupulus TaxID=3486 RepID=UPI002B40D2ED|nr:factor of DNA methylation 5-like isoform X1 [Humulus lupulus]XP_062088213.1 factor of DNA methylation 5-like isoform X1 [Humulus lupulus]